MSTAAGDPIFSTDFMVELMKQLKACDPGRAGSSDAAELTAPFVITDEKRRTMPVTGGPDAATIMRINAFYNAIATLIEKECGAMAISLVNLSHEGFGRVVITKGKLVVLDKTLRDVHRFGFRDLKKMKDESDKYLSVALQLIGKYPEVARM
ncbi:MAG: NifX-associated nitrogen fixation protein [Deltaproteobacteria bacterium]|nr:NifX-associated nitrogen fixation protein [Deltaproteobacteria bacterium]